MIRAALSLTVEYYQIRRLVLGDGGGGCLRCGVVGGSIRNMGDLSHWILQ